MIKQCPSDFRVEEILQPGSLSIANEQGPFALYRLKKESLATPEAISRAARSLGVGSSGAFAYAGLKDKHASTMQYVTLKWESTDAAPKMAEGPGWTLEHLGYLPRSILSSDIHRNHFTITIRNLSIQACGDMSEAVSLLGVCTQPKKQPQASGSTELMSNVATQLGRTTRGELRIVNYFGDQRFGSARHGKGFVAPFLMKGDFENALRLAIATEARKDRMEQKVFKRTVNQNWGRWRELLPKLRRCPERRAIERLANSSGDFRAAFCALPYLFQQLAVYAYQSHVWNAIARRFIERYFGSQHKIIAAHDRFGEMLFPCAEAIPSELASLQIPLFGHKTELLPPWKEAAEEVLIEEGVKVPEFLIPGVRRPFFGEEPRSLFFIAENFCMSDSEPDETSTGKDRSKRTVSFALPRGCYATVLLRALGQ